jgi:putative urate catabolism protein
MQRDFIGYGRNLPKVVWPNNARLALNFVLNYEEGSESNILDGDDHSEGYLTDLPGAQALKAERHLSVESLFEYGSRAGIWRLLRLFDEQSIPLTLFATGLALERNKELSELLKQSHHEIAGHGYRWINYRTVNESLEKEQIQKTIEIIQSLTQKKVKGWYTGRRSSHTRKLVVEAGLLYDSDSYADDLPYWINVSNQAHLIIPYQRDTNDARYAISPGWNTGEDFFQYLKASFEYLYREGLHFPKMMTVGMHARLSGRPGRCEALYRFIKFIKQFDDLWICRREEIATHWNQNMRTQ